MLLHMLTHVSLLREASFSDVTGKGFFSLMHAGVVQKIPRFDELLSAVVVAAVDDPLTPTRSLAGQITERVLVTI